MASSSGPGKSYRKSITLIEIVEMFPSEKDAEDWFIQQRWPDGLSALSVIPSRSMTAQDVNHSVSIATSA